MGTASTSTGPSFTRKRAPRKSAKSFARIACQPTNSWRCRRTKHGQKCARGPTRLTVKRSSDLDLTQVCKTVGFPIWEAHALREHRRLESVLGHRGDGCLHRHDDASYDGRDDRVRPDTLVEAGFGGVPEL